MAEPFENQPERESEREREREREQISPSPPPAAPIAQRPALASRASSKSTNKHSLARSAQTPTRTSPRLNAKLEESAKAEFEDILAERDAVRQLNELDRLVGEAKLRRDSGMDDRGEGAVDGNIAPHTLPPEELFKAHLTPHLEKSRQVLDAKIEATEAQNIELAQKVQGQRAEIERLLVGLEAVVADVEGAAAAASQFADENSLRKEALQMDQEVKARLDM
ncbi:spindle pole protein [Aspergillus rambellii]|uniref:Spindle pole protein n=1 Tax=Aspergillus rambellii TaxID=308745 RepID=A0A0F8UU59_9EURO|nr:spindle pole protein [Aspergillus rambellii]